MKYTVFILTFMSRALCNGIKLGYAFNKPHLQETFGFSDVFLGVLDMCMALAIMGGNLFRYSLITGHNLTLLSLKGATNLLIGASIVPLFALFYELTDGKLGLDTGFGYTLTHFVVAVGHFGTGLYQFTAYPVAVSLLGMFFEAKSNGFLMGLWSSSWEVGNIFAVFLSYLMIHIFDVKWQMVLIVIVLSYFLNSLCMRKFIEVPIDQKILSEGEQTNSGKKVTTPMFFNFIATNIRRFEIAIYLMLTGMISASFYVFLTWLPIFFYKVGFESQTAYLCILLQVAAIFGAFVYGGNQRPEDGDCQYQNFRQKLQTKFLIHLSQISMLLITILSLIFLNCNPSTANYTFLVTTIGFLLGGTYNSLQSKDFFTYFENDPISSEMIAYCTLGANFACISVFQVFTGYLLGASKASMNSESFNTQSAYFNIFYVAIIINVVALFMYLIRSLKRNKERIIKKQQVELKQIFIQD